jgi:hypothetical protein
MENSGSGKKLLTLVTNFSNGSRKKCLENLIVAHKKDPPGDDGGPLQR